MKNKQECAQSRKYNPSNKALIHVFDGIYYYFEQLGLIGNLVACCGKDIKRYKKYIKQVTGRHTKTILYETDSITYNEIKNEITEKNIEIKKKSIFQYRDLTSHSARIEDISIGKGLDFMLTHGTSSLFSQSNHKRNTSKIHIKAQILNCSLRNTPVNKNMHLIVNHVKTLGLVIKTINGKLLNDNPLSKNNGEIIYTYTDNNKIYNIYQYIVEFEENDRQAELYFIKYRNNGPMLTIVLIWR